MSEPHQPVERGTVVDVLVAGAYVALVLPLAAHVVRAVDGPVDAATVAIAMLLGVAATDLTSGVVHWFCDTFFDVDTPVLGRALIQHFREHHDDPSAMTRRSFLCTNRTNLMAMTAILAVTTLFGRRADSEPAPFGDSLLLSYALAVVLTNELHKLAHRTSVPAAVRWLQAHGLVVSPAHHARHHDGHGRFFCVTTGWLNQLLDRTDLFRRIERLIRWRTRDGLAE
jgi:ubiquitin-conjugating enzyme E2 variant